MSEFYKILQNDPQATSEPVDEIALFERVSAIIESRENRV
jgi:hypothetical protein